MKCSIKVGFISPSSSFDMRKFHHLLGCHPGRINSSFNSFLSALMFNIDMLSRKHDIDNSSRIIYIIISIIKVNIIKTYTKNTRFITINYGMTITNHQGQILMLVKKNQQLYCIFFEFYIYHDNILT